MTILPQLIYRLNAIPIKIQQNLVETGMLISNVYIDMQTAKNSLMKKNKERGLVLLEIKLHLSRQCGTGARIDRLLKHNTQSRNKYKT